MSGPEPVAQALPALAEQALARQELCRFLAGCYYEPGPEFAQERLFESIVAAAQRIDPGLATLAQRLGAAFATTDLQDLLVDYARLFLGTPSALAKPYASVWLTGEPELMQDSAMALLKLYEQGGFEIDPEFHDLPDHIAVELEFLYLLTHQCNQAAGSGDGPALQAAQVLRSAFLVDHLGRWLGPFVGAIREHAQCEFYRTLAELTELFVGLEGRWPRTVVLAH